MRYKKFFIVQGKGQDDVSILNAFDKALMNAGIAEQNLIPVSSILVQNPVRLKKMPEIPVGEMIHVVMARKDGIKGDTIGAGLVWACGINSNRGNIYHGIVAECGGNYMENEVRSQLKARILRMSRIRKFEIKSMGMKTSTIERVRKKFGCVIAVLVYRDLISDNPIQ